MTTSKKLQPGDQLHWLRDGLTYSVSDGWHTGEVSRRGQTITVTSEMLSSNADRDGASFFDLIDDPDAQIKKLGSVFFGRGEFPATESVYLRGTPEWERAREAARVAAHAIPDESARGKAVRAVQVDFGPAPTHQHSTTYRGSTAVPQREEV